MAINQKKRRKLRMDNEELDSIISTLQSYGWNITTKEEDNA